MKPFNEQIDALVKLGYGQPAARAKVAHDAILLAMARSGFKKLSTVKGGVVMSHVTNDIRRTTMDMDIAFVKHSISDLSIRRFVNRLNCLPRIRISTFGTIGELLHDDYRGKRAYLDVTDGTIARPIRTKLDIGVHTHGEIKQVEYDFRLADEKEHADLFANSKEQIFAEKLLSLIRFRALSKRPKDVFDMYFLRDNLNPARLRTYVSILIYKNPKCQPKTRAEVVAVLKDVFASRVFMRRLASAKANWVQVNPEVATKELVNFVASL